MAAALSLGDVEPPRPDGGETRGLLAAFLVALALHAGALGLVALWRGGVPTPPGEQEITIDLAPQMVEAPSVDAVGSSQPAGQPAETVPLESPVESVVAQPTRPETTTQAAPVELALAPPETRTVAEPSEATAIAEAVRPLDVVQAAEPPPPQVVAPPVQAESVPPSDARPIESTAVEALPLPPAVAPPEPVTVAALAPEPVQAPPVPVPRPEPKPEPVERKPAPKRLESKPVERKAGPKREPPPERVRETAAIERPRAVRPPPPTGAAGPTGREAQGGQASRENAGGAAASAVDPAAMSRWTSQIAAALRGRLRYPEAARGAGASGVATLRFTLHRSGRVVSASLARSAGHPALDQAALATAGGALPAAPDGVPQSQVTISVPLRFDMR